MRSDDGYTNIEHTCE